MRLEGLLQRLIELGIPDVIQALKSHSGVMRSFLAEMERRGWGDPRTWEGPLEQISLEEYAKRTNQTKVHCQNLANPKVDPDYCKEEFYQADVVKVGGKLSMVLWRISDDPSRRRPRIVERKWRKNSDKVERRGNPNWKKNQKTSMSGTGNAEIKIAVG